MKRFNLTVPGLSKRIAGEKRPPSKTIQAIRLSKSEASDEIQIEEIGIPSGHSRVFFSLFESSLIYYVFRRKQRCRRFTRAKS